MAKLDPERFEWIENHLRDHDVNGVTVKEFAKKFWISESAASVWLSRWTNYYNAFRDIVQHFLRYVPDPKGGPGRYIIGPDYWGERAHNPEHNKGGYSDHHDLEGLTPHQGLLAISGMLQTRTDKQTGKRTTAGIRTTKEKLFHIHNNFGMTVKQYAAAFHVNEKSAAVTLSRWRRIGLLEINNGVYDTPPGVIIKRAEIPYHNPAVEHGFESGKRDIVDPGVG